MNLDEFIEAIKELNKKPSAYDTQAVVTRVEDEIIWVDIPGSEDETPIRKTINAKAGDVVQVRISGGTAFLVGNETAPPTDDSRANHAVLIAAAATEAAAQAQADIDEEKETFWSDNSGAHVEGKNYRNDIKSDGLHIVEKSTGETVARFGADGAQLGKDGEARFESSYNALRFTDMDDEPFFELMDARNREGIATILDGFTSSGGEDYVLTFAAIGNDITVYVDDEEVDSSEYEYIDYLQDRPYISFFEAPPVGSSIKIVYTTYSNMVKHFTFGSRVEGERKGGMSFTAGNQNIASEIYAVAIGDYNQALGNNAVALGTHLIAGHYQAVFGKWNERDSDAVLIVGDGSTSQRENVFVVKKDGIAKTRKGTLTTQTATTTWTTPTIVSSSCTIDSGGYFVEGKHVYVQMKLNLAADLAANTNLQLFEDMPVPSPCNAVLSSAFGFRGDGNAFVNESGELYIRSADAAATTSTNIYITGHYVTA